MIGPVRLDGGEFDPRYAIATRDDDGRWSGIQVDWLCRDLRSFSDILGEWVHRYQSVDAFRVDLHLNRAGISRWDVFALCGDRVAPAVRLQNFLVALLPTDVAGRVAFRNRAASARRSDRPEVPLEKPDFQRIRDARLLRFSEDTAGATNTAPLLLGRFLERQIMEVARAVDPQAEIDLPGTLKKIASHIGMDYQQLLGEKLTPASTQEGCVEQLGTMLGLDDVRYADFKVLATECWSTANRADRVALPRMLRFARHSAGFSQIEASQRTGVGQSSISGWETAAWSPPRELLVRHAGALDLSDDATQLLIEALPAARAYTSRVAPLHTLLSNLIRKHSSDTAFLASVGLSKYLSEEQLERLQAGTPPGLTLGNYLSAFAAGTRMEQRRWLTAASHARALTVDAPIELRSEHYTAAREGMLQRIATDPAPEETLPTLARMLHFARASLGLSHGDLRKQT